MKKLFKLLPIFILSIGLTFTSCKKDQKSISTTDTNSIQQLTKDDNQVQASSDDVINDANDALSNSNSKSIQWSNHCNVTLDSIISNSGIDTLVLTYNGLNCKGTFDKKGIVYVVKQKNTHWSNAGTSVTIIFNNLSVTKVSNSKTFILNGTKIFTNVSGGLLIQLGNGYSSIIHEIKGNLNIKFDDGTNRTWNISRRKTFTGSFNISTLTFTNLMLSVEGFGTSNGYTNLETYGTNRNGELFYTQINSAIQYSYNYNWKPVSGQLIHQIPSNYEKATLTYGYDSNNNSTTIYSNITEYKLDWIKGNKSGTMFILL